MTILNHPDNIQDTYYNCGPATVQVLLAIREIDRTEQQLAEELGTTTAGTGSVDDLARVLNNYLGAGTYHTAWIPNKPATSDEVDKLRKDIAGAIRSGFGVGLNVVGTATTADGSEVNSYPGGHYIPVTGYEPSKDLVYLTDVADGHQYWMTMQAVADWTGQRGYTTTKAVNDMHKYTIVSQQLSDGKTQLWLTDGMWARKIGDGELADIRYLAKNGCFELWNDGKGNDIWSGLVPAHGVPVEEGNGQAAPMPVFNINLTGSMSGSATPKA